MDINLGARYFDLEEAKVDKSPREIVVTENNEIFFIINGISTITARIN